MKTYFSADSGTRKLDFRVSDPSLIIIIYLQSDTIKKTEEAAVVVTIFVENHCDFFKKEIIFPRIHIKILVGSKLIKNHLISGVSKLFSNP